MPDRTTARQRNAILEALEGSSPATTAELASTLDAHPMTVERRCRALQRDGHIRLCTGGVYAPAESDPDRNATRTDPPTADQNGTPSPAD